MFGTAAVVAGESNRPGDEDEEGSSVGTLGMSKLPASPVAPRYLSLRDARGTSPECSLQELDRGGGLFVRVTSHRA